MRLWCFGIDLYWSVLMPLKDYLRRIIDHSSNYVLPSYSTCSSQAKLILAVILMVYVSWSGMNPAMLWGWHITFLCLQKWNKKKCLADKALRQSLSIHTLYELILKYLICVYIWRLEPMILRSIVWVYPINCKYASKLNTHSMPYQSAPGPSTAPARSG